MKWFLVWVVVSLNPDTGQYEWEVVQEAQDSYTVCVENLTEKNAEYEALMGTPDQVDWQIFCAKREDIHFDNRG